MSVRHMKFEDVLTLLSDGMSKPYWVLDEVLGVLQWMSCIRTDRLQQSRTSKYDKLIAASHLLLQTSHF